MVAEKVLFPKVATKGFGLLFIFLSVVSIMIVNSTRPPIKKQGGRKTTELEVASPTETTTSTLRNKSSVGGLLRRVADIIGVQVNVYNTVSSGGGEDDDDDYDFWWPFWDEQFNKRN